MCSQTGFERGWHWTLDLILPSPDAKCLDYRLVPPHHVCAELGSSLASMSWTPGQHTTHSNCTSRLAVIALWFPLLRDVKSVAVLEAFLCLWCGGGCVVVVQSKRIQSFICLFFQRLGTKWHRAAGLAVVPERMNMPGGGHDWWRPPCAAAWWLCWFWTGFFFWGGVAPDIRQNIPFYVSVSHKFIWKIEESAARLENKCVNNGPLNSYK